MKIMNSDRFIVNRGHFSIDESSYWLHHEKPSQSFQDYLEKTPITQQDIHFSRKIAYIKSLSKVLNVNEDRRLLPFNTGHHEKYTSISEEHWPVKPRLKPVAKPQFQVLDLPQIINDIKCNVVHWSKNDYIAAGLNDVIYLWHVPTSVIAHSMHRTRSISALRIDNSGRFLAFSERTYTGKKLIIWDLEKRKESDFSRMPCNHRCYVTCIDWHVHNKYLAVSCSLGNLTILSPSMKIIAFLENAHKGAIFRAKFSPDGNSLATTGEDPKIRVWMVPHLRLIHYQQEMFYCRGLSWHPWRSSYLCYGTFGGHIALINTSLGKLLHRVEDKNTTIYDVSFNKKTAELVTSHSIIDYTGRNAYRWRAQINVLAKMNHVVDRFIGHHGRILYLEWSPDGNILASAGSDETIYLWHFIETNEKRLKSKNISFKTCDFI